MSTIELRNITKNYPGVRALRGVNFRLNPGDVHCLVGENGSGKSTLIKIISGVEMPEKGGDMYIAGKLCTSHTCESALLKGIQVIYQDISLFPNLTVRENIAFRHYINERGSGVNWKKIGQIATQALNEIGVDIDLDSRVGNLSIAQQQLVEIARSLTGNIRLLILDEPTASLTRKEVSALFLAIKKIKERGVSVLFVSHKLNEVFEIAESVTVLRDGAIVGEYNSKDLNRDKLTYLMTGHNETYKHPVSFDNTNPYFLEVKNLTKKDNYKNVNFHVSRGEILGIIGLLGSGRTEVALSLFGMNKPDSGEIFVNGDAITINSQAKAKEKGIAYVSENRRDLGLIQEQSIENNMIITVLKRFLNKLGLLNSRKYSDDISKYVQELDIKIGSYKSKIKTLSGGNQQKVVLAKWLATYPKLLILDEPTVGIDVIAKSNIHQLIKEMAEKGMSIIMISDELQEVINNCHRVLIMDRGKIVHEFFPKEEKEEDLLRKFNLA